MRHGPAPMILADIPLWLNISINLLLVLQVVVSILLVGIVMMQRPKQEGLGAAFGGGMTDQMFGARTTSVLQKGTVYLGVLFFVVALLLAILIGQRSQITKDLRLSGKPAPAQSAPATPGAPVDSTVPPTTSGPVELEAPVVPAVPVDPAAGEPVAPATEPAEPSVPAEPGAPAEPEGTPGQ
jgi:preprotein translocase subunit SecG